MSKMEILKSVTKVRITMDMELDDQQMEVLRVLADAQCMDIPAFCETWIKAELANMTDMKVQYPLELGQWYTRGYELPWNYQEWIENNDEVQAWLNRQDNRDYDRDQEAYDEYIEDEQDQENFPCQGDDGGVFGTDVDYDGHFEAESVWGHGDPPESDEDYGDHPPYCDAEISGSYDGDFEPLWNIDSEDPDPPGCHPDEIIRGWVDRKNKPEPHDLRGILKGRRLARWHEGSSVLCSRAHIFHKFRDAEEECCIFLCGGLVDRGDETLGWLSHDKPIFSGSICPRCLEALKQPWAKKSDTPLADAVRAGRKM